MKKNGFTAVELLLVIAIIGILAAMLLPALAKAKARQDLEVNYDKYFPDVVHYSGKIVNKTLEERKPSEYMVPVFYIEVGNETTKSFPVHWATYNKFSIGEVYDPPKQYKSAVTAETTQAPIPPTTTQTVIQESASNINLEKSEIPVRISGTIKIINEEGGITYFYVLDYQSQVHKIAARGNEKYDYKEEDYYSTF